MPMKTRTAFATFNGAAAQAFIFDRESKRLTPLPGFPMAGEKKPEFSYDKGRVFNSADDRRSAAEPRSDHEHLLERGFVAKVADILEGLRKDDAFDKLVVSAGPRALGYWREVAPEKLSAVVGKELDSDFASMDPNALVPHVEKALER